MSIKAFEKLEIRSTNGAVLSTVEVHKSAREYLWTTIALADINKTKLESVRLCNQYLAGAILDRANMRNADLVNAYLRGAVMDHGDFSRSDLRGANLAGAYMICANLSGANLSAAQLRGADLSGADLRGANLRGANLRGAILQGAQMDGADLSGADLDGAKLLGTNVDSDDPNGAIRESSAQPGDATPTGAGAAAMPMTRQNAIGLLEEALRRLAHPSPNANGASEQTGGAYWRLAQVMTDYLEPRLVTNEGAEHAQHLIATHGRVRKDATVKESLTPQPAWHDSPTSTGIWAVFSTDARRRRLARINQLLLNAATDESGYGLRWFGPLPEDTGGKP